MPGPRADFICDECKERWELPVRAVECPECGGPIVRQWDTPPMVSNPIYKTINAQIERMAPQYRAHQEGKEAAARLEKVQREAAPLQHVYQQTIQPAIQGLMRTQQGRATLVTSPTQKAQNQFGRLQMGGAMPKPKPIIVKSDGKTRPTL